MSDEKSYTLPTFESHLSIGEPFWDFFTSTSVNIECDFDYDEGIEIDECGFCYSSLEMPDINTSHAKSDLNHYVINTYIDDLKAGELLYVRGYAIDGENVAYGPQKLLNIYIEAKPLLQLERRNNVLYKITSKSTYNSYKNVFN